MASTVNEVLLTEYLLATSNDDALKGALLNNYLEQFRTTVFRQTMFAEFEKLAYSLSEQGIALTPELFKDRYLDLNKKYFGAAVNVDDRIGYEWARIPHFYNSFYVYQYATGFSAAVAIAQNILKTGKVDNYIEFLKSVGQRLPHRAFENSGCGSVLTPAGTDVHGGVLQNIGQNIALL